MDARHHTEDLSDRRFLVTGGGGFIGSHIARYLLQNGAGFVRVLDNFSTGRRSNLADLAGHPALEIMEGDIRDVATCRAACEGIHHVSHQAALGSVPRSIKDPVSTNDVNAGGFVNVITAAKDAGVRSFVYASSSSVYGDEKTLPKVEDRVGTPLSPYAVTKKSNELYAHVFHSLFGMNVLGLRYFNVFGPSQDPSGAYAAVIPLFVEGILNNTPVWINGDGEQTRDFTFVDNAVQANIRGMLMEDPAVFGTVYNVAVGEQYTVNFLYNSIRDMLGNTTHEASYREPRAGDIPASLADISRARRALGYQPSHRFLEGLRATVDYFREEHAAATLTSTTHP